MSEHNYQDAVQVLKNRLGGQWEGAEIDGRSEMAKILRDELGFDRAAADDAINAMVQSGTLRYHRADNTAMNDAADARERNSDIDPALDVLPLPVGAAGLGAAGATPGMSGMASAPIAAGFMSAGHWDIGDGAEDELGRKGQVTPR